MDAAAAAAGLIGVVDEAEQARIEEERLDAEHEAAIDDDMRKRRDERERMIAAKKEQAEREARIEASAKRAREILAALPAPGEWRAMSEGKQDEFLARYEYSLLNQAQQNVVWGRLKPPSETPSRAAKPRRRPQARTKPKPAPRIYWRGPIVPRVILADPKLSANAKVMAAAVAGRINPATWNKQSYAVATIAEYQATAGIGGRSTAQRALAALKAAGYIEVEDRNRGGLRIRFSELCRVPIE